MEILLIFTLCLISDGGASKEVTGYSGGGVLIKCEYNKKKYTQNEKYFCKGSAPGCNDQIKTGDKNEWVNSGRFSLFDDTKSAEFWVMIRELTVEDTGTYQCGVDKSWIDIFTPVKLKVKEGGLVSREVRAYAGGGINIKCRYEDEYKDKPKSFCKIGTHQWCFNGIQTKLKSEWAHDGRFAVHDNRSAGFFNVAIRQLITEDTGAYACAVIVSDEIETYTEVKLNVREDLSYKKSLSETVNVGGDLNFSCKYPVSLRNDPKFLCKRLQPADCSQKASVNESRKDVNEGKFSLYDDRAKQIFSMSIRHVTEQDSGEYWCGAEVAWKSDHGYKVYFTQISLTVTDPSVPVSTSVPTKYSLSSLPTSSSLLLSTPTSSERGFPDSTVFIVSVSLLVLLLVIGIIILIVTLYKRRKMQSPVTVTQTSRETNEDYENDPNMLHFQSRQMTNLSDSVYQSLNPNTNQSDSDYQSLNPKTNQSDSVYQSLNPKTNQSDSVYQSLNPNTNQ